MTPRIIFANLVVRIRILSRETSAMFFTVAFPVILVLVFGTIFTTSEHVNFDLPLQDLDGGPGTSRLVESLSAEGIFRIVVVPPEADAVRYAREHRMTLVLVIPDGFEEVLSRRVVGHDGNASIGLTYVYDPSSTSVETKLQYLHAIVAAFNQRMSGSEPLIVMQERSILSERYRFIEFFVPGIIAMAVMTSCLSGALNINAELRQKGILRKLATTPITAVDWLLSNILYQLVLAVVSTAAILLVSYLVFDVRLWINGWLVLYIVLEVFAFVGIGMLLTPIAREAESATAVGNAFLFPMMFLSGTFFPVEMMPGYLQTFARALPLYYINEGLRATMIFSDAATAWRYAVITGAAAAAVFVGGALVTRWNREGS